MFKINKKNLAFIVCVVLAVSSFILYKVCFNKNGEIVLNGNVEIQDVNLSFRVSGRVSKILVDEGDDVKKDDVIAVLDKDVFETKARFAKAQMEEARAAFKNAEKNYLRDAGLFKKKTISEKAYDESKTQYEIALEKMNSLTAVYEFMNIDLKDAELKSPVDGVVLTRNIEPGEMISSGIPAFAIMPHSQTKIKTFADEQTLSKIKYGDKVNVNIESLPNKKFKGRVGFISSEAEFTPKNLETTELRTR
ncbi:MAG: efflux RND transporter periplasmic adaptor subunit [Holosporales bacterium]|jgi:HlyD family secretion protein|nr:efflux RND transporter periplasmic adaptor subunit [Holosporales bacterium]